MPVKQYDISGTVIEISTPHTLENDLPFASFLCEGKKADFKVEFEYADPLEGFSGCAVYSDEERLCVKDGEISRCFYRKRDSDGFFACRTISGDRIRVEVPRIYSDSLWTRVVFSVIGFEELAASRGAVVLHASFIEHEGSAILFTAPCQTGKSTQAELWQRFAGAEIINGDKALIYMKNTDGMAGGLPFSGSSGICKNRTLPIKAIVRLGQAKENSLKRLPPKDAFLAIYKGCYRVPQSVGLTDKINNLIGEIASTVPVYRFDCLPDETAVRALEAELC